MSEKQQKNTKQSIIGPFDSLREYMAALESQGQVMHVNNLDQDAYEATGFMYRLIDKIGAVKTSTVAYFLPVFGIIWGSIFLDEKISTSVVFGCVVVLIGIFYATSNNNKLPKRILR